MLPFAGHWHSSPEPDWLVLLPLYAVFALSVGSLISRPLQRLILKPGRNVGEIQPFLRLLAFVCGLLSVIFTILVATGAFKPAPNPPSSGDRVPVEGRPEAKVEPVAVPWLLQTTCLRLFCLYQRPLASISGSLKPNYH